VIFDKLPHCDLHGDWSSSSPKVLYSDGGRYLKLSFALSPAARWNQQQFVNFERTSRGVCRGFSFGSRRRMLDRLNQVSVTAEHPDFVTLTLPDDVFEDDVRSFARSAKLHLDVMLKRLHRACPSACGFWRIEWKARKSGVHEGKLVPHFHLLVWGLPQRDLSPGVVESYVPVRDCQLAFSGLCNEVVGGHVFESQRAGEAFGARVCAHERRVDDGEWIAERRGREHTFMSFFDWVSLAWYYVVGSGNTDHFLAGCRVERVRTWGGVLSYCAKYMSKTDSENWMADLAVGRSWGIFNRALMPWAKLVELDLDDDVGNRLRRIMRRYLGNRLGRRIRRPYGLTLYCNTAQFKPLFGRAPDAPF